MFTSVATLLKNPYMNNIPEYIEKNIPEMTTE